MEVTLARGRQTLRGRTGSVERQPSGEGATAMPPRTRRGQGLSWSCLLLAVIATVILGAAVYEALAKVELSHHPFARSSSWATLAVLALCVLLLCFVGAVVAVVRSRPRGVAVTALVATVLLPVIGVLIAGKLGVDALGRNLSQRATELETGAGDALAQTLEQYDVHIGPLLHLLVSLLG